MGNLFSFWFSRRHRRYIEGVDRIAEPHLLHVPHGVVGEHVLSVPQRPNVILVRQAVRPRGVDLERVAVKGSEENTLS